jgi:hypothetical protein
MGQESDIANGRAGPSGGSMLVPNASSGHLAVSSMLILVLVTKSRVG